MTIYQWVQWVQRACGWGWRGGRGGAAPGGREEERGDEGGEDNIREEWRRGGGAREERREGWEEKEESSGVFINIVFNTILSRVGEVGLELTHCFWKILVQGCLQDPIGLAIHI